MHSQTSQGREEAGAVSNLTRTESNMRKKDGSFSGSNEDTLRRMGGGVR